MKIQKQEVLSFVDSERQKGRALSEILKHLQLPRSNYYRWIKDRSHNETSVEFRATVKTVTEIEHLKIDSMKAKHPEMRHRQIQGMLQIEGCYLSATSVYKRLKEQGKVEYYERRAAPWDEPLYEVIGSNMMWGADWTQLRVGGKRWYLLNLIDFYSRYVVHFEIVENVCARHTRDSIEQLNKKKFILSVTIKMNKQQGKPLVIILSGTTKCGPIKHFGTTRLG